MRSPWRRQVGDAAERACRRGASRRTGLTKWRLGAVVAVSVAALSLGTPSPAWAHAGLSASDPAPGTSLATSPAEVRLTFTEEPDLKLSSVEVLDTSGRTRNSAEAELVPGRPDMLRLGLGELPTGVYTVSWKVVSTVDGHLTAGSFALGVGVPVVGAAETAPVVSGKQSVLGAVGRVVFYSGLALLLGTAWIALVVLRGTSAPGRLSRAALVGCVAAIVGASLLAWSQRRAVGVSWPSFLQTSLGRTTLWRTVPIVLGAAAIVASARRGRAGVTDEPGAGTERTIPPRPTTPAVEPPSRRGPTSGDSAPSIGTLVSSGSAVAVATPTGVLPGEVTDQGQLDAFDRSANGAVQTVTAGDAALAPSAGADGRTGRLAWALLALSGAVVVVAHVTSGHAVSGRATAPMVPLQALHVLGIAAWIGGLAGLLVVLPGLTADQRVGAARRYSLGAGVCLGVVAVTGVVRAVDEVGAWSRLTGTSYGRLVLAKATVLMAVASLGAYNRFRTVPRVRTEPRRLQRVGTAEVFLAIVALAVTGVLSGSAPAASGVDGDARVAEVVASGADFGTTTRARLVVTPGTPGPNRFRVELTDYDEGGPLEADAVSLRFRLPARPDLAGSQLELQPSGNGTFSGDGAGLAVPGRWEATVLVRQGADSREVKLELDLRRAQVPVEVTRTPGLPTIYTVALPDKRSVQVYLQPERAGPAGLHITFFSASGTELPVDDVSLRATGPSGPAVVPPAVRRFGPGHFVAEVDLTAGSWRLELTGVAAGTPLSAELDLPVPQPASSNGGGG